MLQASLPALQSTSQPTSFDISDTGTSLYGAFSQPAVRIYTETGYILASVSVILTGKLMLIENNAEVMNTCSRPSGVGLSDFRLISYSNKK